MLADFLHSLTEATAYAVVSIAVGSIGVLFKMFLDVRSLKKAMNAAFEKIRDLETKKG